MGRLTSHLSPRLFGPVTWSCFSLGQPFPSVVRRTVPQPPKSHAPRSSKCDLIWKQGLCTWNQLWISGWNPPGVRVGTQFCDL